jgi:K+/H+ antiporter YhaU regulatory subunit KhtT
MTEQQPQQPAPQISPDELHRASGAQFGLIIGRLTVENLELRKLLASAQTTITQSQADQAELERQNSQLAAGAVAYENRIDQLEKELTRLKTIGPEAASIADQAEKAIQGAKIKIVDGSG